MATITVQVSGADKLQAKLNALGTTGRQVVADQLNIGAKLVETQAKKNAPFITGNLRKSIHVLEPASAGSLTTIVEANANYAAVVEEGSRPHEIKPKNKNALRWKSTANFQMAGHNLSFKTMAFAMIVHHPGTKAQPYMKPAAEQIRPKILANITKAIAAELGK
jgi:HK97 gp10 family phage protein